MTSGVRPTEPTLSLVTRRTIPAAADRLFQAWTTPEQVKAWWGPRSTACIGAEIDLRVGGRYRIGNQLADGTVVWIVGVFEIVSRPHKLVYTWSLEPGAGPSERVTVRFEARDAGTEVIVIHERIADAKARDGHALGWDGCLDGLVAYVGG